MAIPPKQIVERAGEKPPSPILSLKEAYLHTYKAAASDSQASN